MAIRHILMFLFTLTILVPARGMCPGEFYFDEVLDTCQSCASVCEPPNRLEQFCKGKCPGYVHRETTISPSSTSMKTAANQHTRATEFVVINTQKVVIYEYVSVLSGTAVVSFILGVVLYVLYKRGYVSFTLQCLSRPNYPVQERTFENCRDVQLLANGAERNIDTV